MAIFSVLSIDDPTANYTTGSLAMVNAIEAAGAVVVRNVMAGNLAQADNDAQALALWQAADAAGSHTLFTTFAAGKTKPRSRLAVDAVSSMMP